MKGRNRVYDFFVSITGTMLSIVGCMLAYGTAFLGTKPRSLPQKPKRPILLVHGYLGHGTNWAFHRYLLTRADVGPVYTINLGSPFHTVEEFAERVQKKAEEIAEETGRDDLALVGHSMGGIISAYYALNLAPKHTVTDLITIASPWRGSDLAPIGIGACTHQMRKGSKLLDDLMEKVITEGDFRLYLMASETDLFIRPLSKTLIEKSGASTSIFPRMGHITFLFSKRVSNKVIAFLIKNNCK